MKRQKFWLLWAGVFFVVLVALALLLPREFFTTLSGQAEVVAYCAQDQVYAEPIFDAFTRATGVRVRPLYDSEAVKTVGLANRLLAERSYPQCDVFWGNEEFRTRQLARMGVFRQTNGLAAFGYRSRRIVINTNLLASVQPPRSLLELTNAAWRGKVTLAYPQFGTTATHFHALRQHWGSEAWEAWCRGLAANQPFLVDGNSVVVDLVGKGIAQVGLTDSDDVIAGQRKGYPILALPMTGETLLIPNTVGVVLGARHPAAAQLLYDYLASRPVAEQLVAAGALEGVSMAEVKTRTLQVNWDALLRDMEATTSKLNEIFLR